jgi:hypothetical protein
VLWREPPAGELREQIDKIEAMIQALRLLVLLGDPPAVFQWWRPRVRVVRFSPHCVKSFQTVSRRVPKVQGASGIFTVVRSIRIESVRLAPCNSYGLLNRFFDPHPALFRIGQQFVAYAETLFARRMDRSEPPLVFKLMDGYVELLAGPRRCLAPRNSRKGNESNLEWITASLGDGRLHRAQQLGRFAGPRAADEFSYLRHLFVTGQLATCPIYRT